MKPIDVKKNQIAYYIKEFSERFKKQQKLIEASIPNHLTINRLKSIAITAIRQNPELAETTFDSFYGAFLAAAQLGLEASSSLQECVIVKFANKSQLITMYRGDLKLAYNSGFYSIITAKEVREKDEFDCEYGLNAYLKHKPIFSNEPNPVIGYYGYYKTKDGSFDFITMSKYDVEQWQRQNIRSTRGPWTTHFDEMAKKTVLRRVLKYAPASTAMSDGFALDGKSIKIDSDTGLAMIDTEDSIEDLDDTTIDSLPDPKAKLSMDRIRSTIEA